MVAAIALFDIDGVVRDVSQSYRRALADTVEQFTQGQNRPSATEIDRLKGEGLWNNDWKASEELIYRYWEGVGRSRSALAPELPYEAIVDFFQRRYRGQDLEVPERWDGYICQEPLLMSGEYLAGLTAAGIAWGFVSGATRASASFVLERRLGLVEPPLVAMGEAPDKPDPTGLRAMADRAARQLGQADAAVLYVGDTVADMLTVQNARAQAQAQAQTEAIAGTITLEQDCQRSWIAVGVLPPHVQADGAFSQAYGEQLQAAGAAIVLAGVEALTPELIGQLVGH